MVVGGHGEIMAGCGWSWVVTVKLWLVVGVGGAIMAGCKWCQQNYGWSRVVVAKISLVVGGCRWSWVVVTGHGWLLVVARFSNAPNKHKNKLM